jgi:hypothetical protein
MARWMLVLMAAGILLGAPDTSSRMWAFIDAVCFACLVFVLLHPLLERSRWWTGPHARLYVYALLLALFSGLYCLARMAG